MLPIDRKRSTRSGSGMADERDEEPGTERDGGMPARLGRAIWAGLVLATLTGCSVRSDERNELLVFAAASLADALGEAVEEYEARTGVRVAVSYGGSQMLAQQIASGAPADVLISAGEFPVLWLADKNMVEGTSLPLLSNRLVVAAREGSEIDLSSIDQLTEAWAARIAIADPELAPAGEYAREALVKLKIWDQVQSKLVTGADVRATLAFVESGNADAALVYATDAKAGRNIEVFDVVPPDSYRPIVYPAAIVSTSRNKSASMAFLEFLRSNDGLESFRGYGFEPYASPGPG